MTGGISNFAQGPGGAPGSSGPLQIRIRPQGAAPLGGGGGALPGDGSYGDPIQGFNQINRQMAETQRAFSATLNASNTINAGFEAANTARNAAQRSQLGLGFDAAQAARAAAFPAPPVTGPLLPPNFAATAQVPVQVPASPQVPAPAPQPTPVPPQLPPQPSPPQPPPVAAPPQAPAPVTPQPVPVPGAAASPPTPAAAPPPVATATASAITVPPSPGLLAGAARVATAARVPLPGPALLPALLSGLVASGLAILTGRSQGTTPTSGSLAPGLDYHFDPAAPGGARVTLTRPDPTTGVPQPDAALTANAQGALTTAGGAVVGRLREGGSFEIDVNALLAAHPPAPAAPLRMTPAPGGAGRRKEQSGGLGVRSTRITPRSCPKPPPARTSPCRGGRRARLSGGPAPGPRPRLRPAACRATERA